MALMLRATTGHGAASWLGEIMKFRAVLFVACVVGGLSATGASAATIVGQNVTVRYEFPNEGSVLNTTRYTIGTTTGHVYFEIFDLTMNDSSVLISFNTAVSWSPGSFNGFTINDTNGVIPTFTGVSFVDSSNPLFTNSRVSYSADRLAINWQGLNFASNDTIRFDFSYDGQVGAVPEPATWAMMIGGFGIVGGAMRSARRKRKVTYASA